MSFAAQTSFAQSMVIGFPGLVADGAPSHISHKLFAQLQAETITPTAANGAVYTVTINGTDFAYTADGSATVAEITAGLAALIAAGSQPVTATDNTTTLGLVATSSAIGGAFTLALSASAGTLTSSQTVNPAAETIGWGKFVTFSGSLGGEVRLPSASSEITTANKAAGVTVAEYLTHVSPVGATQGASASGHPIPVLRKGHIYVQVEQAVAIGDAVFVRYAAGGNGPGSFGNSAGSSERAQLAAATYLSAASANGIAKVELNLV